MHVYVCTCKRHTHTHVVEAEENIKKAIVRHIKPDISKIESFMQYKTESAAYSINNKQINETKTRDKN